MWMFLSRVYLVLMPLVLAGPATSQEQPRSSEYTAIQKEPQAASRERPEKKESWYKVVLAGSVVGTGRNLWADEGSSRYYESHLEIRAARLGSPFEMFSHLEERDDRDGRPMFFQSEITVSGTPMRISGEMRGDTVYVTTESRGFSRVQAVSWEAGALGQASVDARVIERLKRGERDFLLRVFDPQSAGYRASRFLVGERVRNAMGGETPELLAVQQFEQGGSVPAMTLFLDEGWEVRRIVILLMGMDIVIEQITHDEFDRLELDPSFDIIRSSLIPCRGYPAPPAGLDAVTFRLRFSQSPGDVSLFEGPNQDVVRVEGPVLDLLVTRDPLREQLATDTELRHYLGADRYIQSEHRAIQTLADSIARSSDRGGLPLAREIATWVNRHIEHKDFTQGFATALDVLDGREGDCTEHSVLLAAMLRAARIPARVVVGLAYSDGSLVGHMWTEAYIDKWFTVDALDVSTDPIRIRLAVSPDERALNETDIINAYSLVAGLEAEVRDYRLRDE